MENLGQSTHVEWISLVNFLLEFISDLPFILMFIALGYYVAKILPITLIQNETIKRIILFLNNRPIITFLFIFIPTLFIIAIILGHATNYFYRLGWGIVFYTSSIFYSVIYSLKQRLHKDKKLTTNNHILFLLIIALNFTAMYFKYRDATETEIAQCKSKFGKVELDSKHNRPLDQELAVSLTGLFDKLCVKNAPQKRFRLKIK